jgi:hypothetical protein
MRSPGRCGGWLAPPPSPLRGSRSQIDTTQRGVGTPTRPPAGTRTWPPARTFSWPRTLTVAAVARPIRGSVVPSASVPLSGPGGCSPRRRLPGGASSRYRELRRGRRGRHGQQASHGVGRQCPQAVSTHPLSASGIRLSSTPVSGHLGSSSRASGARPAAVHRPASSCLVSSCLVSSCLVSSCLVSSRPVSSRPVSSRPVSSRLVAAPRRSGRVRLLPCSGGGGGDRVELAGRP